MYSDEISSDINYPVRRISEILEKTATVHQPPNAITFDLYLVFTSFKSTQKESPRLSDPGIQECVTMGGKGKVV